MRDRHEIDYIIFYIIYYIFMLLLSRPRPGRLRYHDELSFLILSGGGGGGGVLQRPGRMRGDVYNYNYH